MVNVKLYINGHVYYIMVNMAFFVVLNQNFNIKKDLAGLYKN